jgi:adenylate cyclase class 2
VIEVEVKLAVETAEKAIRLLEGLPAELVHSRGHEGNELFDLPGLPLRERGALLRVRTFGGRGLLTYKEPAEGPSGYKVRREIQTVVDDPKALALILEGAGFRRVWRYEKYRSAYRAGEVLILVDETPIGDYLELEGPAAGIDALAARLGRSSREYITSSYWSLYVEWCRGRGIEPGDLLFERSPSS